jgi:hypothetical protein
VSFKAYLWNKKGGPPSPQVEVVVSNESEHMDLPTDNEEDEHTGSNADESEEASDRLSATLRSVAHSAMHGELFDYADDEVDKDYDPWLLPGLLDYLSKKEFISGRYVKHLRFLMPHSDLRSTDNVS